MRVETGTIRGDTVVDDDLRLQGTCIGNATVVSGGELHLHGIVAGHLHVEPGGFAAVYGLVGESVVNRGTLRVYGVVTGTVTDEGDGTSRLAPGCTVNGITVR